MKTEIPTYYLVFLFLILSGLIPLIVFGAMVSYPIYNEIRTGVFECYLHRNGIDEVLSHTAYQNLKLSDYPNSQYAYCREIVDRIQIDSLELTSTSTNETL